ncbi:hypothetical protein [Encephalitozoon cuniculi GB-M1]|uniref:Uncharacterized protein ECU01_0040 n=1 Tax=Encephalitozoon cuniculi (strain GB-M1) TaxID=284813 RepID=Y104_ENCCU|nr:uncharacterized protein ECU01_0040 [Encephalitozoon cuniculi GB-M1]NP_001402243.1 uncharacterized protein ECU01_1570 [Encephalitozoon cuniculi GB-M1]NP_584688.1 uncharacterized protein ECU04_0050 [Encephalitozoon cuniculi GB-M1]NP_586305.1 uncharacterized protein ECU10_1880 [Encephalitozoon cuniculi GB-M1]NP_597339.1 uncharacterized protein ECU08_2130 [Encephalitozoon cuniculi GB-M1]NP_597342.1 uncharacterized protein ECU05_0020 [Encephalitozoon cuniculi GB-M1]Q8STF2.1 RecName: Full=Unchar
MCKDRQHTSRPQIQHNRVKTPLAKLTSTIAKGPLHRRSTMGRHRAAYHRCYRRSSKESSAIIPCKTRTYSTVSETAWRQTNPSPNELLLSMLPPVPRRPRGGCRPLHAPLLNKMPQTFPAASERPMPSRRLSKATQNVQTRPSERPAPCHRRPGPRGPGGRDPPEACHPWSLGPELGLLAPSEVQFDCLEASRTWNTFIGAYTK